MHTYLVYKFIMQCRDIRMHAHTYMEWFRIIAVIRVAEVSDIREIVYHNNITNYIRGL